MLSLNVQRALALKPKIGDGMPEKLASLGQSWGWDGPRVSIFKTPHDLGPQPDLNSWTSMGEDFW
jgi:hypothetical protein